MSLTSTIFRSQYTGNGATVAFPTGFYFLLNSDVVVKITDPINGDIPQTLGFDYNLSGAENNSGGTVTFTVPPPSDFVITIARQVPLTQEVDFVSNDSLNAETLEKALDKLTMAIQQFNASGGGLQLALKYPETEPDGFISTLPGAMGRAGKALAFDALGKLILSPFVQSTDRPNRLWSGIGNPPASLGIAGDFYINTEDGGFWGKNASGYVYLASLIGPKGDTGEDGAGGVWGSISGDINDEVDLIALFSATIPSSQVLGTANSIRGGGNIIDGLSLELVGDKPLPGNLRYYGTNSSGTKGWWALAIGIQKMAMSVITASGNFVVPAGVSQIVVEVQGGGGSGGLRAVATGGGFHGGGGGGAGGYAKLNISGLVPGASIAVTIGGVSETTSFGAYCSATGGSVGNNAATSGAGLGSGGGIGSGGNINIIGATGGTGTPTLGNGGKGAPSPTFGLSYGAGGNGGEVSPTAGKPGIVIVHYITN